MPLAEARILSINIFSALAKFIIQICGLIIHIIRIRFQNSLRAIRLALTAALSSLHSSFVRVNRVLRTRRVCVLVNVKFYHNDLVFVLLIMLVNSVYRGLNSSIFHIAKVQQNGYLCNSRFVKVVKRTSSLRLVDDGQPSALAVLGDGEVNPPAGAVALDDDFLPALVLF